MYINPLEHSLIEAAFALWQERLMAPRCCPSSRKIPRLVVSDGNAHGAGALAAVLVLGDGDGRKRPRHNGQDQMETVKNSPRTQWHDKYHSGECTVSPARDPISLLAGRNTYSHSRERRGEQPRSPKKVHLALKVVKANPVEEKNKGRQKDSKCSGKNEEDVLCSPYYSISLCVLTQQHYCSISNSMCLQRFRAWDRNGSSDVIRSDLGQAHWLQAVQLLSPLHCMPEADINYLAQ